MESYSSESGSDTDGGPGSQWLEYNYLMLDETELEEKLIEDGRSRNKAPELIRTFLAYNNRLGRIPGALASFTGLRRIDLSNNRLADLPEFLTALPLTVFVAKNNFISSDRLPKSFGAWSTTLRVFDLGGNRLLNFPPQLFELAALKRLYLGGNRIEDVPRTIDRIIGLSVLCLGGNQLTDVPDTLGSLEDLEVLILSDNKLESLPSSIANLKNLKTLQLHKNRLQTLPTEIITLKCLSELSLRENPLVVQFVSDMTHNPATLQEISARVIKILGINYTPGDLPHSLRDYLDSAHHCVNPRCNGVFFDNRVEHIKFVDFCAVQGPSTAVNHMMRKVLLG